MRARPEEHDGLNNRPLSVETTPAAVNITRPLKLSLQIQSPQVTPGRERERRILASVHFGSLQSIPPIPSPWGKNPNSHNPSTPTRSQPHVPPYRKAFASKSPPERCISIIMEKLQADRRQFFFFFFSLRREPLIGE